jgi:hypothetical protein
LRTRWLVAALVVGAGAVGCDDAPRLAAEDRARVATRERDEARAELRAKGEALDVAREERDAAVARAARAEALVEQAGELLLAAEAEAARAGVAPVPHRTEPAPTVPTPESPAVDPLAKAASFAIGRALERFKKTDTVDAAYFQWLMGSPGWGPKEIYLLDMVVETAAIEQELVVKFGRARGATMDRLGLIVSAFLATEPAEALRLLNEQKR